LWLKWLHIVFMVTWFAGLFYLPRLFVYHAMSEDKRQPRALQDHGAQALLRHHDAAAPSWPSLFGMWLWLGYGFTGGYWVHAKTALVLVLIVYHLYCGRCCGLCRGPQHPQTHVWFRWFNEIPVLVLFAAVWLVMLQAVLMDTLP
jgi:putative membrane protein